jgi:rSAM/selenodomain-associated transferase 1
MDLRHQNPLKCSQTGDFFGVLFEGHLTVMCAIHHTTALVVFAKSPIPGTVKTRMQPPLSCLECLELHNVMVRLTLEELVKSPRPGLERFLYLTGHRSEAEELAPEHFVPSGFQIDVQNGKDLGERLASALAKQWGSGFSKIIFVGTDCPFLKAKDIEETMDLLSDYEVVLGPTRDGGYFLIGVSANVPYIFQGVEWGTERVFRQTIQIAREHGLRWQCLGHKFDIDRFEDLMRFHRRVGMETVPPADTAAAQLRSLVDRLVLKYAADATTSVDETGVSAGSEGSQAAEKAKASNFNHS